MKQLNLKELEIKVGVERTEILDVRKEWGDALHRVSESVPMTELAKRIYYSDGPVEISDEDFCTMMKLLKLSFKKFILDSVTDSVEEIKDKEE